MASLLQTQQASADHSSLWLATTSEISTFITSLVAFLVYIALNDFDTRFILSNVEVSLSLVRKSLKRFLDMVNDVPALKLSVLRSSKLSLLRVKFQAFIILELIGIAIIASDPNGIFGEERSTIIMLL